MCWQNGFTCTDEYFVTIGLNFLCVSTSHARLPLWSWPEERKLRADLNESKEPSLIIFAPPALWSWVARTHANCKTLHSQVNFVLEFAQSSSAAAKCLVQTIPTRDFRGWAYQKMQSPYYWIWMTVKRAICKNMNYVTNFAHHGNGQVWTCNKETLGPSWPSWPEVDKE